MPPITKHITSSISLTLITSIFTYRLINALLEYIIFPILNIAIDPDEKMCKLNFTFKTGKNNGQKRLLVNPDAEMTTPTYDILLGGFLKELIIWILYMVIVFILFNNKITQN
jgi:hypothetical protein